MTAPDLRSAPARSPRRTALLAVLLLAACAPVRPPPPPMTYAGLPISGSLAVARRAGFTDCFAMDAAAMRCRRHDVWIEGQGPYEAAVDLVGADGEGGFDQLILWHDRDQYAVYAAADAFERQGWRSCYTGDDSRGDQDIYFHPAARFRVSMDMSYYGKRRLRLIPNWNDRERRCTPDPAPAVAALRR